MNKQAKYEAFLPQLQGLIDETQEAVSVMANRLVVDRLLPRT